MACCAFVTLISVALASWGIDPTRSIGQLQHRTWTAHDGAPTDADAIAQTEDGFLWFATAKGLLRFDGARFERYVPASGAPLPSAPIRSLLAIPGNGLLVGWVFGGATLLQGGKVTHWGEKEGYPPGSTYSFVRDRDGYLWGATSSALARYDGKRWERIGGEWNFRAKRATSIFIDRDGTLGAFSDSTLLLLPAGSRTFRETGGGRGNRLPILQSPNGTYFYLLKDSLRRFAALADYDRTQRAYVVSKRIDHDPDPERRPIIDRDGGLWFSTPKGLGRLARPERGEPQVEYYNYDDGGAHAFFEDAEGSIWVVAPNGIERFRAGVVVPPLGAMRVGYPAMVPDPHGGLWFAGLERGLRHATPRGDVREIQGPYAITCAFRDQEGSLWLASQAPTSVFRLQGEHSEAIAMPDDLPQGFAIQSMARDSSGTLWMSVVRNGVYRRDGHTWSRPKDLPDSGNEPALVVASGSLGRVWIGYLANRIAQYEAGKFRLYGREDGLDLGNVSAIHDRGGRVWFGGERGVAFLDGDRFVPLVTENTDAMLGITGVVETREGDLWLHGTAGAARIAASELRKAMSESGYRARVQVFDDDDGLRGLANALRPFPTLVEGADGRLWIATNLGVFELDPRAITTNSHPPNVVINSLTADGNRFIAPANIELPPLTTSLEIDYTATSLSAPRRVRFRYRLVGVDDQWRDADTRRQAYYTNLRPGSYRFHVIASNEDGVWNTTGAEFDLAIAPAWYQTRWFAALAAIAIVATILFALRLRMRQVRAQIQGRLQERLLERERIARELHDTLIQGSQGLLLTLAPLIRKLAPGEPRAAMEKALEHAQCMLAEGRDRVRDLRNSMAFHGDLPTALKDAAADFALEHPTAFALSERGARRDLHPVVLEEAFLIAREGLANAFRHASATEIAAEIDYGSAQFRVRIRDDGKGVDGEIAGKGAPGHWGLLGMRERARKMGARLLVRSGTGSGTEVELDIPAEVAYRSRGDHGE